MDSLSHKRFWNAKDGQNYLPTMLYHVVTRGSNADGTSSGTRSAPESQRRSDGIRGAAITFTRMGRLMG